MDITLQQLEQTIANKRKDYELETLYRNEHKISDTAKAIIETVEIICRECGKSAQAPKWCAKAITRCQECSEEGFQKNYDQKIAEPWAKMMEEASKPTMEKWQKICPAAFLLTKPCDLPCQNALKRVMAWEYRSKGLILHSATSGRGKSRVAWLLAQREYLSGRTLRALTAGSSVKFAAQFSDSTKQADQWVEKLIQVDLLLLDDTWKDLVPGQNTGFERAIYSIIDRRTMELKPMIITTNEVGETLEKRFSPDRGKPLVRRLREFCDPISFE